MTETQTQTETHTDDATAPLEQLRAELDRRGWTALMQQDGSVLYVRNPDVHPPLDDEIVRRNGMFAWSWGSRIGPITDARRAADHITHVLRTPVTNAS